MSKYKSSKYIFIPFRNPQLGCWNSVKSYFSSFERPAYIHDFHKLGKCLKYWSCLNFHWKVILRGNYLLCYFQSGDLNTVFPLAYGTTHSNWTIGESNKKSETRFMPSITICSMTCFIIPSPQVKNTRYNQNTKY